MTIPVGSTVSQNDKGDFLITYSGDMFATLRVKKDGTVWTTCLGILGHADEKVNPALAEEARNFVNWKNLTPSN